MRRFFLRGNLEAGDGTSLRVHGTQHMIDGAVLACRVAPLQTDQQRPLAFGVHQVLKLTQFLTVGFDFRHGVLVGLVLVFKSSIDL